MPGAADLNGMAFDGGTDTASGRGVEILSRRWPQAPCDGGGHDHSRQRVFAGVFGGCGPDKDGVGVVARFVECFDVGQLGCALGEGAGLVERDDHEGHRPQ
jgi:hypothetical protein